MLSALIKKLGLGFDFGNIEAENIAYFLPAYNFCLLGKGVVMEGKDGLPQEQGFHCVTLPPCHI